MILSQNFSLDEGQVKIIDFLNFINYLKYVLKRIYSFRKTLKPKKKVLILEIKIFDLTLTLLRHYRPIYRSGKSMLEIRPPIYLLDSTKQTKVFVKIILKEFW